MALWPSDEGEYPSDGCEGLGLIFALSGYGLSGPFAGPLNWTFS